jgi:RNA polymerase sigma-32 factor
LLPFIEYARTGDPRLAQDLVQANMGLAVTIARSLDRTGGRHLPDLIQEGHLGLIEALRRFDPHRGVGFSSYAAFWIRALILKYLRDNARLVRVGRSRADRAAYSRGELPPAELSLDAPARGDERDPAGSQFPDGRPNAEALLERAEVVRQTLALAGRLDVREQTILRQRLLSDDPQPLRRVARRLSLSGERVRQIEGDVLAKLRRGLHADRLAA